MFKELLEFILFAVFISQPLFLRELLMVAAALGSYVTTRKSVHAASCLSRAGVIASQSPPALLNSTELWLT